MEQTHSPSQSKLLPWVVVLTATLFFFYEFVLMNMFNAIDGGLARTFSVDATKLGYLSASYFYADVIFLFPAGLLLDRFSTRKLILVSMGLCVGATVGFALSPFFWMAVSFRFLSGIGNAFAFVSSLRLAARWFEPRHLALVTGVIVTFSMLGGVIAQTPLTVAAHALGWRHAILVTAAIGFLFILLIWRNVKDYPKGFEQQYVREQQDLHSMGVLRTIRLAIRNRQNWCAGIYTCFLNLPVALFGSVWGIPYLVQAHGYNITQASYVTSMVFAGTIVGSPLVGWFSDYIGRRRLPMFLGGIISLAIILIIMYMPNLDLWSLIILFFAIGLTTSSQVIAYPMITESNPSVLTGGALGFGSMLIMSGYAIFQPVFGKMMDLYWDGKIVNHIPVYSPSDYRFALWIMPIGFILGLVAVLLTRETHCQPLAHLAATNMDEK